MSSDKPRVARKGSGQTVPRASAPSLPDAFNTWLAARGWNLRPHQASMLEAGRAGRSTLLIAPTGAGKTLAGFLPSLVRLTERGRRRKSDMAGAGLDTLYLSPLKALAVDVARNVLAPIEEMGLAIRTETRTGDTSLARRQRQRAHPPDILMTTPEQLALLLSHADAAHLFADLKTVILDELHALAGSKRGDLLALDLARLRTLAPAMTVFGLSATVARPSELRAFLVAQSSPAERTDLAELVVVGGGAAPDIEILELDEPVPWSGHSARYAMHAVYDAIRRHKLSLVFVNTRMQAELIFQELWRINEDNLPIALHHGSLDRARRQKVEAAMAEGRLKAVVATSTLDLGIDWGDVDLVVNVGAPKGASRLIQRIGRANHRLDEPSKALLVPANRFEVLECRAALEAAEAGDQDAVLSRTGGLDVLAQHVLGTACAGPFDPERLLDEVRSAAPYAELAHATFERVLDFVSTGGYALRSYERFAKLKPTEDGRLRLAHPRLAQQYRMNAGTIVDSPVIKVHLVGRGRAKSRAAPEALRPMWGGGTVAMRPNSNRALASALVGEAGMGRTTGTGFPPTSSHRTAAIPNPSPRRVEGAPSARWGGGSRRPLVGGRVLGEVDEYFVEQLRPGDTFVFAGEVVRFEGLRDTEAFVSRADAADPMIPSYGGGKFPLSTHLARRVRAMLAAPERWRSLPTPVRDWLELQRDRSALPGVDEVLVETFPRAGRHYLVAYPFEGRLAHQTLGMLLTRRLERAECRPLGFVANDYAIAIWGLGDVSASISAGSLSLERLFEVDMLGDDLDAWLAESSLMKRTFRLAAVIAGLIERRSPGREKSGRQVTMSTDLVYDVLRRHDPGHILLEAAWADAATGLLDVARLGDFLRRIRGRIRHQALSRVSPLSVPVLLEIGRETVGPRARDDLLREAARELMAEAGDRHGDARAET